MLGLFKKKKNLKIQEYLSRDALIIDVRSQSEYRSGHIKGSTNVPLNRLSSRIAKIQKANKPVITCCASGMRSGSAASMLKSHNIEVVNGGAWQRLKSKINSING